MIEFRGVTKRFGAKTILDNVDLTIKKGEIVFVVGRSGMGKSVTLKLIVGLLRPDSGEVRVAETRVDQLEEKQLLEVRRQCGMVFQFPALLDSLSVFDNIAFGVRAHHREKKIREVETIVHEKLALVNLPQSVLNEMPSYLSFGVQKRVSIARTIAVNPDCLLFDEPTTGLDPVSTRLINDLILSLSRALKVTSVVVSHDMHCALQIADRILLLDSGKIVAQGAPKDLIFSDHPLARGFLKQAKERLDAENN